MHENNPQDPRNRWRTNTDPSTGEVTITNSEDNPGDANVLLQLPYGAKPVDPGPELLEIYPAMVIGARSRYRDFSDQVALDRCREDVRTAITYVLGWAAPAAPAGLHEEAKHRVIMEQLRVMPTEMLDNTYNLYRIENHGINLDDHPEYRTYQTFYEMGITQPRHEGMAGTIIAKLGRPSDG